MKIALQVYTLREAASADMANTLKIIAEKGYSGVELAGFNSLSPDQIHEVLKKNSLTAVSAHFGFDDLESDTETWCQNAKILGMSKITIPWISPALMKDDHIQNIIVSINKIADKLALSGIELSYHNHDIDFSSGSIYKLMEFCPKLKMELDTYWAKFAGVDPLEIMEKYADRITLIHIKDMQTKGNLTNEDANPNILEGSMDIKGILKKAENIGLEWAIVEYDRTMGDPIEAVSKSRSNLKAIGY
jgi:sugar phosphate isomerase/epimerase